VIKIRRLERLWKDENGIVIDRIITYQVQDKDGRVAVLSLKDWLRVIRAIKKLDKLANIVEIELQ